MCHQFECTFNRTSASTCQIFARFCSIKRKNPYCKLNANRVQNQKRDYVDILTRLVVSAPRAFTFYKFGSCFVSLLIVVT